MSIWTDNKFPTGDFNPNNHHGFIWGGGHTLSGKSRHWKAKAKRPFCWTPTKAFWFGGREFIPLYPCIAFETRDHGHVIQRRWNGLTYGKE